VPTYEFRCPDGHDFERFYKTISGAASEVECPECGKVATRQMSAAGFSFKGSGFYLTDYGKNAHRGDKKADAKADGKTDAKADGKADAKADVKADTKSDVKADTKSDAKADTKSDSKAKSVSKPKPTTE
jgi:putative FmdB family regulatory protein